jgi:MFS family permease
MTVLFLVSVFSSFDRNIIAAVLEPIKREFNVSDTQLGFLTGLCFSVSYAIAGIPVARWADRGNRRTIITLAVALWSAMTLCCGLVHNFTQLTLARMGVGLGESGAGSPAQSLIADYFPPERRATAVGTLTAAATAGSLLGIAGGGYVAATYGWRPAFIYAGLPGLVLALLARLRLTEPRLRHGFPLSRGESESIRDVSVKLLNKTSYLYAVAAWILYSFFAYGVYSFAPSYLVRGLHAPLAQANVTLGVVDAAANFAGALLGGYVADIAARRDIRWLAWLPALGFAIATPLCLGSFAVQSFWGFMALDGIGSVVLAGSLPALLAAVHAVCGNRRRATALAILFLLGSLIGAGVGPLVSGALSDHLSLSHGDAGLRYSLMLMMVVPILVSGTLLLCGRAMPADLEE